MSARITEILYKKLIIFCICYLVGLNAFAEKRHPLWNVEHEFSKETFDLRGPVYSVTNMRMRPIVELGEVVRTNSDTVSAYFFDENGIINKSYHPKQYPKETSYKHTHDSVLMVHEDGSTSKVIYKYDEDGRIIEAKYFKGDNASKRIVFEYSPKGYGAVTYEGNKKWGYQKDNNKFVGIYEMGASSGTLNSSGQTITEEGKHILGGFHDIYAYNSQGDLISKKNNERLGTKNITAVKNESGERYEYVYDEQGNWTEKRTYENGKLKNEYEAREIVYMSPEEIIALKKAELEKELEKIRLFEEELQKKGERYASKFVKEKKQYFKEYLSSCANNLIRYSVPIENFGVTDDKYTFVFSDGAQVNDVKFEAPNKYGRTDNLISRDLHIVLIPFYTPQGPKWYVVRYGKYAAFDFNPNDSTDWVKIYRDEYNSKMNVSDSDIERVWDRELFRQWNDSRFASFRINHTVEGVSPDLVLVNELVDAYEKGFVSPTASDKERESESLEKYKKFKEDEKRQRLCTTAYSACVFNDKNKPEADKLKKFTCDESGYYFKKKDNNEIVNPKFDTEFSCRDVSVYLSSDQTVALVLKRLDADCYLFIVELDGDNVKSVNYISISRKDVMKFQYPTDVEYRYYNGCS